MDESFRIEIESGASDADKALANLADSLKRLNSALRNVSGSDVAAKMRDIASGINEIGNAVNNINSKNLENLAVVVGKVDKNLNSVKNSAEKAEASLGKAPSGATTALDKISSVAEKAETSLRELGNSASVPDAMKQLPAVVEDATTALDKFNDVEGKISDNIIDADFRVIEDNLDRVKDKAKDTSKFFGDWASKSAALVGFGSAIGQIANGLDGLANKGNSILMKLYSFDPEEALMDFFRLPTKILPVLSMLENRVKDKLSSISDAFKELGSKAQGVFDNIVGSFQKILQRISFTLLRKAINAAIKDIEAAMISLAQSSTRTGREFNSAMSSMVSNARWVGSSLVAAFSPIMSAIAPIIDALVAKLVSAIRVIGMFFAALTGKGVVAVAKKNMTNFGAATDKAAKSAKKLQSYLLGIDELNVFQKDDDDDSGSGGGAGSPYDWEEMEIPDWIKDWADKFKKLLEDLFYPLKEAWDRVGPYVIAGFKYMIGELSKLARSIGRDFMEMWHQEATIRMFEDILRIIGDIEYTVGNLAKAFREAWDEGRVGLHIFEAIRDIFATLIHHVRNATLYMRGWSETIDFSRLLNSFEKMLRSLNKVADFIGGVFEDVFERVILRHIKWMIEDGLPHLFETIKKVVDAFDFDKIRDDLTIVEDAFENLRENIDTGIVNAIGNVGRALASWTNSAEFTEFMNAIASIMARITPERVEKLFTALGTAILNIVKALANFVKSDTFQKFLDHLADWFDKVDGDKLAKAFEILAGAIAGFKFAAFIGNGFKNFLTFLAMAKLAGLGNFTKAFSTLTGVVKSFGSGIATMASGLKAGDNALSSFAAGATKTSSSLSQVSKNMSLLEKGLTSVVAVVSEFLLVSDAFETFALAASGAEVSAKDMGIAIVEAIGGAAAAWAAFSLVFNSSVIGAIAAAVVGLVAALKGAYDVTKQLEQTRLDEAFSKMAQSTSVASHTLGDYVTAVKQTTAGMDETFAQLHDSFQIVEDDRYSLQKTIDTIGSISVAMSASRSLTETEIAELGKSFENLKDQLAEYVSSSYDFVIQQMYADMQLLDSQNQLSEAEKRAYASRIADLEIKKQSEIDANNAMIDSTQKAIEEYVKACETYGAESHEAIAAKGELENAIYTGIESISKYGLSFDGVQGAVNEATENIKHFTGELNIAKDNASGDLTQLKTDVSDTLRNMTDEYNKAVDAGERNKEEFAAQVHETMGYGRDAEEAIARNNEIVDGQLAELETTVNTYMTDIQDDVLGLMPDLIESLQEQEYDDSEIRSNLQNFVDEIFTGDDGLTAKFQEAYDTMEADVVPYGEEAANNIIDSIFDVKTWEEQNGATRTTMAREVLADDWKTIIKDTRTDSQATAEEEFAEVGKYCMKGAAEGLRANKREFINDAKQAALDGWNKFQDASGVHSPSWKYAASSYRMMEGARDGIVDNKAMFIDEVSLAAVEAVEAFDTSLRDSFAGLMESLFTEDLPQYFGVEMWQPLFDSLLNDIIMVNFDTFRTWFTEEAMTPWWEEEFLPWFSVEKWDEEIFTPIDDNIKKHVEGFIKWWKEKISKWFAEDVEPWFALKRWTQYGKNMQDGMYTGFKGIVAKIGRVLNGVVDEFNSFISSIETAINSLIDMYNSVAGVLGLPILNHVSVKRAPRIKIPAFYEGGFVPMGDPKSYSLFAAGENGVVEMVGQVGGRPAVASGDEITGIRDAVNESGERQEELLSAIVGIAQALLDKDPVVLGDRDIAEASRRGSKQLGMAIIS